MSKTFFISLAISLLFLIGNVRSSSTPPPPAMSTAECDEIMFDMADCLTFVLGGSTETKPSSSCCDGLKTILKMNEGCICYALRESAQLGIVVDVPKAEKLPAACGVKTTLTCDVSDTPTPSPPMAPSPPPKSHPKSPSPPPKSHPKSPSPSPASPPKAQSPPKAVPKHPSSPSPAPAAGKAKSPVQAPAGSETDSPAPAPAKASATKTSPIFAAIFALAAINMI